MYGCIWTPPDCNSRLDQDRWSQLLTYIRLRDAAGQRLRREPRWVFARFHLNGSQTSAEAVPVHTSGSGSDGVTVSPSLAFCCNYRGGTSFSFTEPSGHFHRPFRVISGIAREHRPDDSRVLVSKCHRRNICMSPLPQFSEPKASWILLAASSRQGSAGTVDHQRAQVSIAALADAK